MRRANLLIIGGANGGKTVAACNTFYKMTRKGGVSKSNNDKKFRLVADDGADIDEFSDMYLDMLDGKLPKGTTESTNYELGFTIDNENICEIRWMDYRGGLRSNKKEFPEEWKGFCDMLEHATILIYIIPGGIINDYIRIKDKIITGEIEIEKAEIKISNEINHIQSCIEEAKKRRNDNPPILFYVTKSDLIEYDDERKMKELKSLIREYNLLGCRKVLGCHSTLGRDLYIDKNNRIVAGFKPEGFEIPLMLSVGYCMSKAGKEWEKRENDKLDIEINRLQNEAFNLYGEKLKEQNKLTTKIMSFLRKDVASVKKIENEIKDNKNKEDELKVKKAELAEKNKEKKYSNAILDYISNSNHTVFYIDEQGKESILKEFFE